MLTQAPAPPTRRRYARRLKREGVFYRFPGSLVLWLRLTAIREDRPAQDLVIDALTQYLQAKYPVRRHARRRKKIAC